MQNQTSAKAGIYRISTDALFVALYVVLSTFLSFKIPGFVHISFSTLPILLCAFLFGPLDAAAVALLGTLLEQIIDPSPYGFATLPIWLIPGLVTALIAAFGARGVRRIAKTNLLFVILSCVVIVLAELSLTGCNTVALYLDAHLLHYPVSAVHVLLPTRLINGLARSVISCVLVPILLSPLRRVLARRG